MITAGIAILVFVGTVIGGILAIRDSISGAFSRIEQKNDNQDQRIEAIIAEQRRQHDEEIQIRTRIDLKLDAQSKDIGTVLTQIAIIAATAEAVQKYQHDQGKR